MPLVAASTFSSCRGVHSHFVDHRKIFKSYQGFHNFRQRKRSGMAADSVEGLERMKDLDFNPESISGEHYDYSQVQQLLSLADSLMEHGQALDGEIDAIYSDEQGSRPTPEELKKRFLLLVTEVIFVLQQALVLFPELLQGLRIQRSMNISLGIQTLRSHERGIDDYTSQLLQMNRQTSTAYVKLLELDGGTWMRPKSRDYFYRFFLELYYNNRWREIMKMSLQTFFWLCGKMAPRIRKNDTNYRQAIPVPCRLAACVYKLVTGCRSAEIMTKFGIGRSTLYSILRQVIPGIIEVLGKYIEWPSGQAFHETVTGIEQHCGFPYCSGVVGGCDIPIVAPAEDPWAYMNANQEYSVVLQVVCNHERKFTSVYVGQAGSMDFSGVLRASGLYDRINRGTILTDDPFTLPGSSVQVKPYLLGDSGYPCLNWLMTPYKCATGEELGPVQRKYNHNLLAGKRLIDQSFAILKSTFRELSTPCLLDIELVPQVIGACCVLHNILVTRKDVEVDDDAKRNPESDLDRALGAAEFQVEPTGDDQDTEEEAEAVLKRDRLAVYLANFTDELVGLDYSGMSHS